MLVSMQQDAPTIDVTFFVSRFMLCITKKKNNYVTIFLILLNCFVRNEKDEHRRFVSSSSRIYQYTYADKSWTNRVQKPITNEQR